MATNIGPEFDDSVAFYLTKHYGDLLKVSKERFCIISLPLLRKYVAEYPEIINKYEANIRDEIEGQGLEKDAVLRAVFTAQLERLRNADKKDSTAYAKEIEAGVKAGITDRIG